LSGREFQTEGPATEKARLPNIQVLSRYRVTTRSRRLTNRYESELPDSARTGIDALHCERREREREREERENLFAYSQSVT